MADGMFKDLINSIENADIFFNPSKYVEREVAREFICKQMYFTNSAVQSKEYDLAITHAWQGFNYVPNADVVEVVRCKDCMYFEVDEEDEPGECKCGYMAVSYGGALYPRKTDYCSYAERKCDNDG